MVVSALEVGGDGRCCQASPVRIRRGSEGFASGRAHPIRTRQGRMVVVAVMVRGPGHDGGALAELPCRVTNRGQPARRAQGRRQALGETPKAVRNVALKWEMSLKPTPSAIAVIGSALSSSRSAAARRRAPIRY